jgi:hypothetical protein
VTGKLQLLQGFSLILLLAAFGTGSARAAALILNGGFESGFTNWTLTDEPGGATGATGGWIIQTGTTSPITGLTVPAPPQGTDAAMTDASGPGSHSLIQAFTVAPGSAVTLSFDLFVGNQAGFFSPASLDFNTIPNQQARVDILTSAAGAFALGASVVDNVLDASADTANYVHYSFDITTFVGGGGTFKLRFAEVDNEATYLLGVDDVSITSSSTAVPEPGSWLLAAIMVAALMGLAEVKRRAGFSNCR